MRFEFVHHRFNAFFEVAAIACASQQRTHVEREDGRTAENFRYCALDNTPRQAFGNGSFADTRVADIEWIVFRAPTQYLNRALNFVLAPDQRVDVAALSFSIEIDAIGIKCFTTPLDLGFAHQLFIDPRDLAAFAPLPRDFGDTVGNIIHRIEARHILLLKEIDGMGFALGKQGGKNICARRLATAG